MSHKKGLKGKAGGRGDGVNSELMDPDILAHRGDPLLNGYGSTEERGSAAVGRGQMWENMRDNIDNDFELSLI
jgi:hypothetical protein